jgi:CSLREA domain-containing protein
MRFARLPVLALLALLPSRAPAVTFHVNSTDDHPDDIFNGVCADSSGKCTLRAAIMEANLGGPSANYVIELPAGTYTLTRGVSIPDDHSNGDLDVSVLVTILGSGAKTTIVDANHLDRAFKVTKTGNLLLSELTIRNGLASSAGGRQYGGGAILNHAFLILQSCVLDSNTSPEGGGGGAVAVNQNGGPNLPIFSASKTTFSRNGTPTGGGGGVFGANANATFDACTFSGNTGNFGGGVAWINGELKMQNTTLFGNDVEDDGGGIYISNVPATILNSTLGGNAVDSDLDGDGSGGGLYAESSSVVLWNSVFANLNDNTHANDDCHTDLTTVTGQGTNVLRSTTGCAITGLVFNTDPLLGALKDNGGPTATQMLSLSPPSPAVDAGPAGGCPSLSGILTVDQRGVKRPIGSKCDLGAVELEPVGDANGDGSVNVADVFYLINFLFAGGPVPKGRSNVNGGASVDVGDVFYLINYLFAGGPAPI